MAHRRIIVQEIVSLDGLVADASGGLDFFEVVSDYSEVNQENLAIMETVDTLRLGAKTYQPFVDFWPTAEDEPVADVVNSTPKVVFPRPWAAHRGVDSIRPASSLATSYNCGCCRSC